MNRDGELIELKDRATVNAVSQVRDKVRFFQVKGYAVTRGYKSGWVAHKLKRATGYPPRWDGPGPVERCEGHTAQALPGADN